MRASAIGVVIGINMALAGVLAYLWSSDDRIRWTEPAPMPLALEEGISALTGEPADVSRYRETLERPLFASTRRVSPRVEPGTDAQAVDALKGVVLLGAYGSGERGGIVIASGGAVRRLAFGERLGEWKVVGEEGRSVGLVRANGERRQLELALNVTAPAALAKASSEVAPEAAASPATSAARASPEVTQRAALPSAAGTAGTRDELRQQYRDRANARRAARGLPPISK